MSSMTLLGIYLLGSVSFVLEMLFLFKCNVMMVNCWNEAFCSCCSIDSLKLLVFAVLCV